MVGQNWSVLTYTNDCTEILSIHDRPIISILYALQFFISETEVNTYYFEKTVPGYIYIIMNVYLSWLEILVSL